MSFARLLSGLGPGLLYAGAAVGVSHLVMSTKAGAGYEFLFLWLIPLIHFIKYPFFKYGPEYTALTGKSILHGYFALGRWAIVVYVVLTLVSMCLIQAAVTIVTSSIAVYFFDLHVSPEYMPHIPAILILLLAAVILYIGQYSALDKLMKLIIVALTVSTLTALAIVLYKAPAGFHPNAETAVFAFSEYSQLIFLAAFLGWMPAPMDISVWHSVWAEEANATKGKVMTLSQARFDFRVGFIGTALLAIAFLSLGALVMFGSGEQASANGAKFAEQLMSMYTDALGSWAYPVIGVAALATMFSTTLTCLDAYPRTLEECYFIWTGKAERKSRHGTTKLVYRLCLAMAVVGTIIVFFIVKNVDGAMGMIVTVATIVSFIAAPVIAYINYRVICGSTIKAADRPKKLLKVWSQLGILLMAVFSIAYLYLI